MSKKHSKFQELVKTTLELSVEKKTFTVARGEWVLDHLEGDAETFCTCGHQINNAYHMLNLGNQRRMILGSKCVTLFGQKHADHVFRALQKKRKDRNYKMPKSVRGFLQDQGFLSAHEEFLFSSTSANQQILWTRLFDHLRGAPRPYPYRIVSEEEDAFVFEFRYEVA